MPGGSSFYFAPGDEIEFTQGSVSLLSLLMKFVSGGEDGAAK
jgi:phospholipid/cholesterol/gamma-HCH transport system substrate-binding protein